jgi:hypothetical protein
MGSAAGSHAESVRQDAGRAPRVSATTRIVREGTCTLRGQPRPVVLIDVGGTARSPHLDAAGRPVACRWWWPLKE